MPSTAASPPASTGDEPLRRERTPAPARWAALALALGITAFVAIAAKVGFSSRFAGTAVPWVVMGGANGAVALIGIRALFREDRRELRVWFFPRFGDVAVGMLGAAVFFAVTVLGQHVFAPTSSPREAWIVRLYLLIGDPAQIRGKLGVVFAALVAICLSEEIAWRGYVRRVIMRAYGDNAGLFGSAILYAAAHLPTVWALADDQAGGNPLVCLAAISGGLLWGAMVRMANGRLVPALIAHVAFDWAVLVMFRLWGPSV